MVDAYSRPVITGYGESFPGAVDQQELWDGFFAQHFAHRRSARMAFSASGVTRRHAALNPMFEDVSQWSTGARMNRYLIEAMPLGKEALNAALTEAELAPEEVGLFVVVSCTGYATPGLDIRLARDLGMSASLQRLSIGHVGCHAALPALRVVNDFVASAGEPALLLCLEISSLHVQPSTADLGQTDLEQVVVHSLFSDGAAAITIEPSSSKQQGLQMVDLVTLTDMAAMDHMTWNVTDHGFRMTLSRKVSDVVSSSVEACVTQLLERNSLTPDMIDAWAVHPGGPRILDVVGERLGLADRFLCDSRQVLAEHGNCSSPTILLVLDAVRRRLEPTIGQHIVGLSFGPGMTLCAALFRTT